MALVVLSKVEQRLDAVRAVLAGATVTEVAAAVGVSRVRRACLGGAVSGRGLAGLADRSHRPASCPHQARGGGGGAGRGDAAAASAVGCEADPAGAAEEAAGRGEWCRRRRRSNRILIRQGLVLPRKRKRPRESYRPLGAAGADAAVAARHRRRGDGWSTRSPGWCGRRRSSPGSMTIPGSV